MLAVIYMNIRTTNADIHNLYQYLIIFYLRNWYLSENNLSWFCHYLL